MSFKRHLTAGIALTLGLVVLSGSALAAPPSTPPGQEKKAEKQAEQQAPAPESEPAAATAESSSGINATAAGVKPSNNTDKHTSCKTGGSGSSTTCTRSPHGTNPPDSSKRYGNSTTAAQIATSRGAPAGTEIRGPGNSQPHKVCGKNGHFIDVHAVKSYVGLDCTDAAAGTATAAQQQSQATVTVTVTTSSNSSTTTSSSTSGTAVTAQTGSTAGTGAATGGLAGTAAAGGVAGAATESTSPQSGGSNGDAGGVLGAFGVAGVAAGGALPFTGFSLWLTIVLAIGLIAAGWTLQRRARPVTRDVV